MSRSFSVSIGILLVAVAASLPYWLLTANYLVGIGVTAFVIAAIAVAWNLISGLSGRLSFGHAAFFGVGAYTSSLLLAERGISPWLGGLAGMVLAGLLAVALGVATLRLRGIYFTLVTFVFSLILLNLARYFGEFTGGDVGLSLPLTEPSLAMMQFRDQIYYYYIALAVLVLYVVIAAGVSRSPFGYRLRAIRDDEEVAEAVGVATTRVKLQAFILSAAMTAFGGTILAQQNLFIDPGSAFGIHRSIEIALGAIFGGIGTVWGPVVGGIAVVSISEGLNVTLENVITGAEGVVYGAALIAVALWLPGGLISLPRRLAGMVRPDPATGDSKQGGQSRDARRRVDRGERPDTPPGPVTTAADGADDGHTSVTEVGRSS
jgi:branched-chain amino acid transport system permease protein